MDYLFASNVSKDHSLRSLMRINDLWVARLWRKEESRIGRELLFGDMGKGSEYVFLIVVGYSIRHMK